MTLVLIFIKQFWKQIVVAILISTICYTGYYKIKSIGYKEASEECAKKNKEYNDKLDKLIVSIENNTAKLISSNEASKEDLRKNISNILVTIKNKPLYTITQGKCTPSVDFINAYNEAVERVNN